MDISGDTVETSHFDRTAGAGMCAISILEAKDETHIDSPTTLDSQATLESSGLYDVSNRVLELLGSSSGSPSQRAQKAKQLQSALINEAEALRLDTTAIEDKSPQKRWEDACTARKAFAEDHRNQWTYDEDVATYFPKFQRTVAMDEIIEKERKIAEAAGINTRLEE